MQVRIKDKRSKGWFFLDNKYLNGYAKIFGAVGTAIYVSLCRHADAEQRCFPSQELIAKELGIATRTVRKYLKMFIDYNLIQVKREKSAKGRWLNNVYYLIDKSEWKSVQRQQVPVDNQTDDQRQLTTKPEATDDTIQRHYVPTKNTNKKNTNKKELAKANGKAEYGNPEVNTFLETLKKEFELGLLDGSAAENRKYAWLAIKKCGRLDIALAVIKAAAADDFYGDKIASAKKLYYHMAEIVQKARGRKNNFVKIS